MNDWDTNYRKTPNVFGAAPAPILERHTDLIEKGLPVLDVGCGFRACTHIGTAEARSSQRGRGIFLGSIAGRFDRCWSKGARVNS